MSACGGSTSVPCRSLGGRCKLSRRGEHTSVDRPSLPDSGEEPCVIGRMHLEQLRFSLSRVISLAALQQSRAICFRSRCPPSASLPWVTAVDAPGTRVSGIWPHCAHLNSPPNWPDPSTPLYLARLIGPTPDHGPAGKALQQSYYPSDMGNYCTPWDNQMDCEHTPPRHALAISPPVLSVVSC